MSRRRKKVQTVFIGWDPSFAGWFRMVPPSWTPPERVRVTEGASGRGTVKALFRTPEGRGVEAFVRYARSGQDEVTLGDEGQTHRFVSHGAHG